MLVLTRKIGQALLIDDEFIITLQRYDADSADLSLANDRGVPTGQITARRDSLNRLIRDIEVVLVASDTERVRLGFQCVDDNAIAARVTRKEHRDGPADTS